MARGLEEFGKVTVAVAALGASQDPFQGALVRVLLEYNETLQGGTTIFRLFGFPEPRHFFCKILPIRTWVL